MTSLPPFGTRLENSSVRFRLWAPDCGTVSLRLEDTEEPHALVRDAEGWYEKLVDGVGPGTRYRFQIDGDLLVPDPASRFQPNDIHGVSEVIDPEAYRWQCTDWRGRPWEDVVLYELHVGTFSPEGTFRGVTQYLDELVDLGVTAIELMPVADFPGARDWGYNGALLFAPDSRYGRPEDLKALIDAAHQRGLMVFLDVVYNHFGPEGNYLYVYAKRFFDATKHTPWGAAIDFEGPSSHWVREFFIQNAVYWIDEYCFDGLRFDAVHAIDDGSPKHILDEIAERVYSDVPANRHVHLVLENDRNQTRFLRRTSGNRPAGYVAQWNDDSHHCFHVLLTGETDGYYIDYAQNTGQLVARVLAEGFAYQGDPSPFRKGELRGEPSTSLPPISFVNFLQNHDQIGNRAFGDRLTTLASTEALRAAATVLLLSPAPPMLFMGEEWACLQPFLFFCDFGDDLKDAVREGRRREFADFGQFADASALAKIPDPTIEETYHASVLDRSVREQPVHRAMLDHYRQLLHIRHREIMPRLRDCADHAGQVVWTRNAAFRVDWTLGDGSTLCVIANLSTTPETRVAPLPSGRELFDIGATIGADGTLGAWSVFWRLIAPSNRNG